MLEKRRYFSNSNVISLTVVEIKPDKYDVRIGISFVKIRDYSCSLVSGLFQFY